MKKLLLITAIMLVANSVMAAQNYSYQQEAAVPAYNSEAYPQTNYQVNPTTLKGRIVTVPAGEDFRAVLTTPISSATAVAGQTVTLALNSDFYYNGNLVAPAGSSVSGTILEASRAKHGSLNGKLSIRFTNLMTPTGQNIPISAVIKTEDGTGVLIGGTKMDVTKNYAKDLTIGAGAGALAGVIISPLAGGNIGRGTALSTAVGAGGGLAKSIWDKGNDVEIPIHSLIELRLIQPITINPISSQD
jgi:hypothetical protein